jgi:hypothetical protein
MVSIAQREGAEEFLSFEGDFEGECVVESTKINLNSFASWKPDKVVEGKLNDFDQFKEFLVKFLSDPAYEDLFEKADVTPVEVVRNIADWVDTNERVNEPGGIMGAPEDSLYERKELSYPLKNGKFTTPQELYLVEGVVDEWFFPLESKFTIYGDEKVDVCNASDEVVASLIRRYVENKPDALPIDWNDTELVDKLVSSVMNGCAMGGTGEQLKKNVSQALEAALAEISGTPYELPVQTTTTGGTTTTTTTGSTTDFAKYISTENRFFSLKLTGLVGDIAVTIRAVLDVKEKDPKKWKLLYWRVY